MLFWGQEPTIRGWYQWEWEVEALILYALAGIGSHISPKWESCPKKNKFLAPKWEMDSFESQECRGYI